MSTGVTTVARIKRAWAEGRLNWKSLVAFVLFSAIILVFVLFGLRTGNETGIASAARVNNVLISIADFQQEMSRMEQMWAMFGPIPPERRRDMERGTLERLVSTEVAAQSAESEGILSTDAEVREVIVKDIPAFQKDGRFQRQQYLAVLEANRLTPGGFEGKIRKEKILNRTQNLFEIAASPSQLESEKLKALKEIQMNLSVAKIEKPKEADALAKFDENMKQLDEAVGQGDLAKINSILGQLKVNWTDTGYFDLQAPFVASLPSQAALEAATELNQNNKLLKRVVRDGDSRFILQLKDIKKVAAAANSESNKQLAREKSSALFSGWIESERKKAAVQINTQILSR